MQIEKQHNPSLAEAVDIGFLRPEAAEFYQTPGGFTGLRYEEKDYPRISLRRALPVGQPDKYISVADAENKEIGILRELAALRDAQLNIVSQELDKRYYCPVIRSVDSVKDKMGYVYIELTIEGEGRTYPRTCAVKDINKNIRMLDDDRLLIFDVDGNRFIVQSLNALGKKSLKMLEPYLF